jgi:glycosyltransferase involved in cell wall biosynthesis
MGDDRIGDVPAAISPRVERVLQVADREVCLRLGPMLAQVWQGLCASGLQVALLTDDRDMLARLAGTPVEGRWLPHLGGWRAWDWEAGLHGQPGPRPDLVHLWGTAGLRPAQRWSRRDRVPLIVHALGAGHVARLMHAGLRGDQHVVVASAPLAVPLLDRFPMAASRCHVVPLAIAPPRRGVPPRPASRTFSVLCVGPLAEPRGLEVLIDAVAELCHKGCPVQVAVMGVGRGETLVWRRVQSRQVQGCVSLNDEPRLWEKLLPEIDACVISGVQRELTIVPLLAMALGKLVIASRDQPAEWLIEDRTCWQFTPGSALELAYLLERAIEQPQRAAETGRLAGEHVRVHHSIRAMVARLVELYRLLCTR